MNLDETAVSISKDLKQVVFVGAYAVVSHLGSFRQTRDIDIALASPISERELEELGYKTRIEAGKKVTRTEDGVKVDIYRKDVSGIPIEQVFATAVPKKVGKNPIMIMGLEALLLAKMRASRPSRPQDSTDIQELCRHRGKDVNWSLVKSLVLNDVEYENLKNTVKALSTPTDSQKTKAKRK